MRTRFRVTAVARCARNGCDRRRPDLLAVYGRWGLFLDQEWYCSTRCVEATIRERVQDLPLVEPAWVQAWRPVKLGLLLMKQVGLTKAVIDAALAEQEKMRAPFGQTLRQLGLVTTDDVLKALATQAGVRYLKSVDPARLAGRPGGLARDTVKTLGIVPVAADYRRRELQVACAAPIPGHAVRALARLTKMAVEPMLVADDALPGLINVYANAGGRSSRIIGAVCDAKSGPARVAQIAKSQRNVVMTQERCDPYVWVRLENGAAKADVLMTLPELGSL
jgi:hypothetical protein